MWEVTLGHSGGSRTAPEQVVAAGQQPRSLDFIEKYRQYCIHLISFIFQPVLMSWVLQVHILICGVPLQPLTEIPTSALLLPKAC